MSDLISREEFLKRIEPYNTDDKMDKALYNFAYNKMMDCSSVEPERKTGKWIRGKYWSEGIGMGEQYGYYYKCSECGKEVKGGNTKCTDRFCKSCGAKMEVDG